MGEASVANDGDGAGGGGAASDGGGGHIVAATTDEDLILRIAAARDKAAFTELFGRYAGRVRGMLMRGGALAEEADEASQETMLAVWRRAASFDPGRAGAATWIFAIARNRRIDAIRRSARPEPDPNDPIFAPDPPAQGDEVVSAAERDAAVRRAVDDLTEAQREVVRLAYFGGLSQQEIADRTGAPLGTVKSRMRLAAETLRAELGADFGKEFFDD